MCVDILSSSAQFFDFSEMVKGMLGYIQGRSKQGSSGSKQYSHTPIELVSTRILVLQWDHLHVSVHIRVSL